MTVQKPRTLEDLERERDALRKAFFAIADRIDPRLASDEEVAALDAMAMPIEVLDRQINQLLPLERLRPLVAACRQQAAIAGSPGEQELYRRQLAELEPVLLLRETEHRRRLAAWALAAVAAAIAATVIVANLA